MAQNKTTLTALKRYLKDCSQEDLISDISELFKRFDGVKDYYQIKLSPQEESQVREKYKKIIGNEFFPARGFGRVRLSVASKAVSDYKKVGNALEGLADIMLFYVEQGVKFTNEYGDIDEPFYNSMVSMYKKAVAWIIESKLQDQFEQRCRQIVKETSGIGWGFYDDLRHTCDQAFMGE